ncbi:hypothetical protein BCR34DRAFT_5950 [Clohesyomyces aquaticus]|uniref:Uncharacterized protein n=1 Tax=Clohesyomyces aquaticus TaxID=1231657 RepID=A0A1Y2AC63_9PLEO|nr:hypothetical protein BCR34DRAFT_5950 [Clohesyomyces aquaticus]
MNITSLRKPGLPLQSAQLTHPRGIARKQTTTTTTAAQMESTSRNHSRTHSSTATGTRKGSSQPRAQLERPRSIHVAPTQRANTVSDHSSHSTRSSARIAALKRPANSESKPEAADGSDSASTNDTDLQPLTNYGRRREPLQEEPKKAPRPAFSTLQQHFTPRKAAKAPTSTFLHPPASDPSVYSLPPEILCLQAELLQLHLLHEASSHTTRQWELSAKRILHGKFDEVASLYQVMRANERQGQEQKNLRALREWSHGNCSSGLIEHIQLLSAPLQELPSLVNSGGRFTRLVDDFARWIVWVEDIWAAREDAVTEQAGDSGSAEGLGDFWKAENAALTRKLISFLSNLDRLTQPASGSSIAGVVSACKELLEGMLEELKTMLSIETSVVAKEKDWVEKRLQDIAQDIGAHLAQNNEGAEAWRI